MVLGPEPGGGDEGLGLAGNLPAGSFGQTDEAHVAQAGPAAGDAVGRAGLGQQVFQALAGAGRGGPFSTEGRASIFFQNRTGSPRCCTATVRSQTWSSASTNGLPPAFSPAE